MGSINFDDIELTKVSAATSRKQVQWDHKHKQSDSHTAYRQTPTLATIVWGESISIQTVHFNFHTSLKPDILVQPTLLIITVHTQYSCAIINRQDH